mmetsp:Transcript_132585/g.424250  ORF Transcript_132585/g.424250 Transcript_132585/m.424250 type:complete len:216 (-) Transcript_132585:142-789(-)
MPQVVDAKLHLKTVLGRLELGYRHHTSVIHQHVQTSAIWLPPQLIHEGPDARQICQIQHQAMHGRAGSSCPQSGLRGRGLRLGPGGGHDHRAGPREAHGGLEAEAAARPGDHHRPPAHGARLQLEARRPVHLGLQGGRGRAGGREAQGSGQELQPLTRGRQLHARPQHELRLHPPPHPTGGPMQQPASMRGRGIANHEGRHAKPRLPSSQQQRQQ